MKFQACCEPLALIKCVTAKLVIWYTYIHIIIAFTKIERRNHSTNSGSSQDDKSTNEETEIDDVTLNYDFALREVISKELNNGM